MCTGTSCPPAGGTLEEGAPSSIPARPSTCLLSLRERPAKTCVPPGRTPSGGHSRTKGKRRHGLCTCRGRDKPVSRLPAPESRELTVSHRQLARGVWDTASRRQPPAFTSERELLRLRLQRGIRCAVSQTPAPPALLCLEPTVELGLTSNPPAPPNFQQVLWQLLQVGPSSCCSQGPAFFLKNKPMIRQELT